MVRVALVELADNKGSLEYRGEFMNAYPAADGSLVVNNASGGDEWVLAAGTWWSVHIYDEDE